jgi:hypothetical protein
VTAESDEKMIALLSLPPIQFKLFMDSIIWAIKHTMRDIADIGLNCMSNPTALPNDLLSATISMLGGHRQLFRGG